MRLVLASSSPFRRMLMENAGLEFDSQAAAVDERQIEAGLAGASAEQVAAVLAKAKALDVSARMLDSMVIGSDQTMAVETRVYHKPRSLIEAKENLMSLSGRTHRLNSAVALAVGGQVVWEYVSHADLTIRSLTENFIDGYLARVGDKVLGSVGAYQLEAEGIQLFSKIEGDYFTILGLPLLPLLAKLRELGVLDA